MSAKEWFASWKRIRQLNKPTNRVICAASTNSLVLLMLTNGKLMWAVMTDLCRYAISYPKLKNEKLYNSRFVHIQSLIRNYENTRISLILSEFFQNMRISVMSDLYRYTISYPKFWKYENLSYGRFVQIYNLSSKIFKTKISVTAYLYKYRIFDPKCWKPKISVMADLYWYTIFYPKFWK